MSKLRVGVIGLGMGRFHVEGFQTNPNAEVVAVADLDSQKLTAISKEFGVKSTYENPLEMLDKENLDVVSVAVPNKFHKELAIAAFERGCHVLCEKPLAMNASEAQDIIDASVKANRRLMVNYSYRFVKSSWVLKEQINAGVLGDVYFGRSVWHRRRGIPGLTGTAFGKTTNTGPWFYSKELAGGGPLIDLGVHRLDLALWFMDFPEPEWVMGSTYDKLASEMTKAKGVEYTVEDLAVGMIKFKNGATLQIEASWAANIAEKEFMETRVLGTKAGLIQKNIKQGYEFEGQIFLDQNGHQFDMNLNEHSSLTPNAYSYFIDCIVDDVPHMADGNEALGTIKILDALYLSAQQGEPVMLG